LKGRRPKRNVGYWLPKLARNVTRDATALRALRASGWTPLVVWECETGDLPKIVARVRSALK
jgi:DNA mismatch endonuclease (patch repair protein)